MIDLIPSVIAAALAVAPTSAAPETRSIRDLEFFIGSWRGQSSFLPAFSPGAKPRVETVRSDCVYVLRNTYIQCTLSLTNAAGRERGVMTLWNFNSETKEYEGAGFDSNWGGKSTVLLRWNAVEKAWIAEVPATTADSRKATERLVYRPSPDGRTIQNLEMIRPEGTEGWVQTFEYVWLKAS